MDRLFGARAATFFLFLLGLLLPLQARAHGAVRVDEGICKLFLGPYAMQFTGYQPREDEHADRHEDHVHPTDGAGRKEFCQDIPELGYTVVDLDAIDPELRQMPLEVSIIPYPENGSMEDAVTNPIVHLPPKIYPAGTVRFEYTFDQPGRFVGIVTARGGKQPLEARFPFNVAPPPSLWDVYGKYLFIIVVVGALYWYSDRRAAVVRRSKSSAVG